MSTVSKVCLACALLLSGGGAFFAAVMTQKPPAATSRSSGYSADEVDDKALADVSNTSDWLAHGRTYNAQRFGPQDQIKSTNISSLKVAWYTDLPNNAGLVSTPLVANSVMYFTDSRNIVRSVEARNGKILWTYDPNIPEASRGDAMQFAYLHGGRGIALWNGKVLLAPVDGRIIALDASTGKEVWSVRTFPLGEGRFITGAPIAFNGKVLISDAGGENGKERGRVTAYDAETGSLEWRFYTVPGDPSKGFEDEDQERAAKTWSGEWWKQGGGGNIFNAAFAYDPQLNTLYIGTGSGIPGPYHLRSPGGGDNLYLSSIVALDADTGKYRWHYQATPQDSWDYDSASPMILADLNIRGRTVKALMQAPKNGFFYVLDRTTGKLISAEPYAKVTWASRIDLTTGRPVINPAADYEKTGRSTVSPASWGAHDWQPMSFNPSTGLAYFGKRETAETFLSNDPEGVKKFLEGDRSDPAVKWPSYNRSIDFAMSDGKLIAWDPVRQRQQWEVPLSTTWSPGTMTTAGNLVFQGDLEGYLHAYDASSGEKLWSHDIGLGVTATPITYSIDGRQYIAVLVGFGGGYAGPAGPESSKLGWAYKRHTRRLVAFALDGSSKLPELPSPQPAVPLEADFTVDPALAQRGADLYDRCSYCHGGGAISGGLAPDLRASPIVLSSETFKSVVVDGAFRSQRMPSYSDLSGADLEALRHYIRSAAATE